jgi:hypothetical protein
MTIGEKNWGYNWEIMYKICEFWTSPTLQHVATATNSWRRSNSFKKGERSTGSSAAFFLTIDTIVHIYVYIYAPDIFTNPIVCLEMNQLKPLAWGPFLEYIWGIIIQITGSRLKTVWFGQKEHLGTGTHKIILAIIRTY